MIVEPTRSEIMRAVGQADTKPELAVRRLLHSLGLRFRLHRADLPGTPDIILPRFRIAIFVNGCFWHRHEGCSRSTIPKTRTEFWLNKFKQNIERDQRNEQALLMAGWTTLTIWECETRKPAELSTRLGRIFVRTGAIED